QPGRVRHLRPPRHPGDRRGRQRRRLDADRPRADPGAGGRRRHRARPHRLPQGGRGLRRPRPAARAQRGRRTGAPGGRAHRALGLGRAGQRLARQDRVPQRLDLDVTKPDPVGLEKRTGSGAVGPSPPRPSSPAPSHPPSPGEEGEKQEEILFSPLPVRGDGRGRERGRGEGFFAVLATAAPLAEGMALRLWHLPQQILGGDEVHAIRAALSFTLPEILITYQQTDNCIPLTALYKLFMLAGLPITEMALRLPVVLCGLVALLALPAAFAGKVSRRTIL